MNALPNQLPEGSILDLQSVSYANLDANNYYYVHLQTGGGIAGPVKYHDYVVFLSEDLALARAPGPWKTDERVLGRILFEREYKRVFDMAALAARGLALKPEAAEHDGEIVNFAEYRALVADGNIFRVITTWDYLPYARVPGENNMNIEGEGEFVYDDWKPSATVMDFRAGNIHMNPGPPGPSYYTFYTLPQEGGRRRRRATRRSSRRAMRRRRSTRRRR